MISLRIVQPGRKGICTALKNGMHSFRDFECLRNIPLINILRFITSNYIGNGMQTYPNYN